MSGRFWCFVVALAAVVLPPDGFAFAQEPDETPSESPREQARTLATEAATLLDAGEYDAALERLEKAESVFHAPTHLLWIGEALEGLGRRADALARYRELASEQLPADAPGPFADAQASAKARITALTAVLPALVVVLEAPSDAAPTVMLNGKRWEPPHGPRHLDPGSYVVRAEAEGTAPVEQSLTLQERMGEVKIVLRLVRPSVAPPPVVFNPKAPPTPHVPEEPTPKLLIAGIPTAVLGGLGLVAGIVTGALAINRTSALEHRCPTGKCPVIEAELIEEATTLATLSTLTFVVGGLAAATGITLITIHFATEAPSDVSLIVSPRAISFSGRF